MDAIAVTAPARQPLLLFIDDSRNIREFCKRELEREGYRVRLGGNGYEALEALDREIPDLVILDIRMRHMDGLEIAERLAAQNLQIPVIFYTACRDYRNDPRARLARAWVEKSEDLAGLKAAIALALAQEAPGAGLQQRKPSVCPAKFCCSEKS